MPHLPSRLGLAFPAGMLAIIIVGACATATGTDSAAAQEGRQCFLPSQVNGFNAQDDETVFVTVGVRQVYRLELLGFCPDVDWSQRIGIRSRGGGSWVCQGLDAELIVPGPTGPRTCPVASVHRLSDEEVRAYRERRRRN